MNKETNDKFLSHSLNYIDPQLPAYYYRVIKEQDLVVEKVHNYCAKKFKVSGREMYSSTRKREVVYARNAFFYILADVYGLRGMNKKLESGQQLMTHHRTTVYIQCLRTKAMLTQYLLGVSNMRETAKATIECVMYAVKLVGLEVQAGDVFYINPMRYED
jgi:hypothetical protein